MKIVPLALTLCALQLVALAIWFQPKRLEIWSHDNHLPGYYDSSATHVRWTCVIDSARRVSAMCTLVTRQFGDSPVLQPVCIIRAEVPRRLDRDKVGNSEALLAAVVPIFRDSASVAGFFPDSLHTGWAGGRLTLFAAFRSREYLSLTSGTWIGAPRKNFDDFCEVKVLTAFANAIKTF